MRNSYGMCDFCHREPAPNLLHGIVMCNNCYELVKIILEKEESK